MNLLDSIRTLKQVVTQNLSAELRSKTYGQNSRERIHLKENWPFPELSQCLSDLNPKELLESAE